MSASLVGSEMCIRDRWIGRRSTRRLFLGGARRPRTSRSDASAPPAPSSVSYTHLTLPTICSV
eukprot:4139327-Alexandrium_andersonii.AAC.1